jgi:hypothetical protein
MVDFARLNYIKHTVETDFDVRTRREVKSEAICVTRYLGTMAAILALPVPTYVEPAPVSGEIDTSKRRPANGKGRTDMWNQNNGNGNGYGQQDDVYGRLNNTKDVGGARFPFIEGSGKYALCVLEEFPHSSDGPSARALLKVLECKDGKHAPGTFVVKIWKLVKPSKFQGQATDADMFADFCRKLKGAPAGYPIGNDIRVLMKERSNEQLARGTVIEAVAVPNKKGTWINVYWNAIPQSPQDIAAMRQRLEAEGIPATTSGPTQPAQGNFAAQQAQQALAQNPAFAQPGGYGQQPWNQQNPNAGFNPQAVPSAYPSAMPTQPAAAPQQGGFLTQAGPPPGTPNGGNNGQGGGW